MERVRARWEDSQAPPHLALYLFNQLPRSSAVKPCGIGFHAWLGECTRVSLIIFLRPE